MKPALTREISDEAEVGRDHDSEHKSLFSLRQYGTVQYSTPLCDERTLPRARRQPPALSLSAHLVTSPTDDAE